MAKQIIWSPLAKEALKGLLISSQERDGNKRCVESGDPQVQFVILDDGGDCLDGTTRRIGDRDGMKITVKRIFAEKALVAADPDAVARIAQNDCDVAIRQLWIFQKERHECG